MRYRYRNLVLRGRWFENRDDALDDAIRAGQAQKTKDGLIEWIDHGSLEEEAGDTNEVVRPAN